MATLSRACVGCYDNFIELDANVPLGTSVICSTCLQKLKLLKEATTMPNHNRVRMNCTNCGYEAFVPTEFVNPSEPYYCHSCKMVASKAYYKSLEQAKQDSLHHVPEPKTNPHGCTYCNALIDGIGGMQAEGKHYCLNCIALLLRAADLMLNLARATVDFHGTYYGGLGMECCKYCSTFVAYEHDPDCLLIQAQAILKIVVPVDES